MLNRCCCHRHGAGEDYESSGTILCNGGISGRNRRGPLHVSGPAIPNHDNEDQGARHPLGGLNSSGQGRMVTGEEANGRRRAPEGDRIDAPVIRLVNHFIARALDLSCQ